MKVKNLAVLSGDNTTVKNGIITYNAAQHEIISETDDDSQTKSDVTESTVRADIDFGQGIIQFKFKAEKKGSGVLISYPKDWNAGLSYRKDSFVIRDLKNRIHAGKGNLKQFAKNEEVSIRFEAIGSNAKLYVNNILFCQSPIQITPAPLTFKILAEGKVSVYDIEVQSIKPKLFVVMQFSDEYNEFYNEVIKPVAEEVGFECVRADEFHASTPILKDIINSIRNSSAIIAEITPDNPNVFYEIGYAHAIDKPTILVCDSSREKLPFDLSSFRTLFYENSISGKSKVEMSLRKYLENIFN